MMGVTKAQLFLFLLLSASVSNTLATVIQDSVNIPVEGRELEGGQPEDSPYIILKASATSEEAKDFREEVNENIAATENTVKNVKPMSMVMPYRFRFNVEDSDEGVYHRRSEVQPKVGPLVGSYSYLRSDGVYMTVRYTAGTEGYRATVYETLPPASYSRSKPLETTKQKEEDITQSAAATIDSDTLGLKTVIADGNILGLKQGAENSDIVGLKQETANSNTAGIKQVETYQDNLHYKKPGIKQKTPSQILRELMLKPYLKVKNPKVDEFPTRPASVGPFAYEEMPVPISVNHQIIIPSDRKEKVPLVAHINGVRPQEGGNGGYFVPELHLHPQPDHPIIETHLHPIGNKNTEQDSINDELLVYGEVGDSSKDQNAKTEVKSTVVSTTALKKPVDIIGSEKVSAAFYLPSRVSDTKTVSSQIQGNVKNTDVLQHKLENVNSVSQSNVPVRLDSLKGEVNYPVVYLHGETEVEQDGDSHLGQIKSQGSYQSFVKKDDLIHSSVKSHDSSTKIIKSHEVYSEKLNNPNENINVLLVNSKKDSDAPTEQSQLSNVIIENHSILTPPDQRPTTFSDTASGDGKDSTSLQETHEEIKSGTSNKFTEQEDRRSQTVSQTKTVTSTDELFDSEKQFVKFETSLSEGGESYGTQIKSEDQTIPSDSKAGTQTTKKVVPNLPEYSQDDKVYRGTIEQHTISNTDEQSDSYGKYSELQVINSIKESNSHDGNLKTTVSVPYEKVNNQHNVAYGDYQLKDDNLKSIIEDDVKSTHKANSYVDVIPSQYPTSYDTPYVNTAINSYLPPSKEAAVESNRHPNEENTNVFVSPDYPGRPPIYSTVELETNKNSKTSEQSSKTAVYGVSIANKHKEQTHILSNVQTTNDFDTKDSLAEGKPHLKHQDQDERYHETSKVFPDSASLEPLKPALDAKKDDLVNSDVTPDLGDEVVKAGNQYGYNPYDVFALKRGSEAYSVHSQQVFDQNRYVQKTQHNYYSRGPPYNAQSPAYQSTNSQPKKEFTKILNHPGIAQSKPPHDSRLTQEIGEDAPIYFVLKNKVLSPLPRTHPIYSTEKKCSCDQIVEKDASQRLKPTELEESQQFREPFQKESLPQFPSMTPSDSTRFQGIKVATKSSIPYYRMQNRLASSPEMQGSGFIAHRRPVGSIRPSAPADYNPSAQKYRSNFYFRPITQLKL